MRWQPRQTSLSRIIKEGLIIGQTVSSQIKLGERSFLAQTINADILVWLYDVSDVGSVNLPLSGHPGLLPL